MKALLATLATLLVGFPCYGQHSLKSKTAQPSSGLATGSLGGGSSLPSGLAEKKATPAPAPTLTILFLTERVTVSTADGIVSLPPGTAVTVIGKMDTVMKVTSEGTEFEVGADKVTADSNKAEALRLRSDAAQVNESRPTIGMTEAEARGRFGEPYKESKEAPAEKVLAFQKGDIFVVAYFFHGRIGHLIYSRIDKHPFEMQAALVLLEKNSSGVRWNYRSDVRDDQNWECADGSMVGINHLDCSALGITTAKYLDAMEAAKRSSAIRSLDGL